jgi:hypothetical protein
MSSNCSIDKPSALGLYVVLAIALLLVLMLCAMLFQGKGWRDDSGRMQGPKGGAARVAREVF